MTRGTRITRLTRPMVSCSMVADSSLQLWKSKVRYCSSTARAMSWYSRTKARRTEVTWTGRYDRLRTRTLVLRTDIAAVKSRSTLICDEPACQGTFTNADRHLRLSSSDFILAQGRRSCVETSCDAWEGGCAACR